MRRFISCERRFKVTFKAYDDSKVLGVYFEGEPSDSDFVYRYDIDTFAANILSKYTDDGKITCLNFFFTTTPPRPSHHGGDAPTDYLPETDELVVFVTPDRRRSNILVPTDDTDIFVDVDDKLLNAVVVKNATKRVPHG